MSLRHVVLVARRAVVAGRQNPMFYLAVSIPFVYTLIFQVVFGAFFQTRPVLVAYEARPQSVVPVLLENQAVEVAEADSPQQVRQLVADNKADVGVVFPSGVVEKLRARERLVLPVYINGESLARNRALAAGAIANALREVTPGTPELRFRQETVGERRQVGILETLLPIVVLATVTFSAFLLPASLLIRDKEKNTISALLATPVTALEILLAYGLVGSVLALLMGVLVLLLNQALTQPLLLLLVLVLGAVLFAEWGLAAGLFFKDTSSLFANMKLFGIVLYAPALFIVFPEWPQWIAYVFPTYYVIDPVFRIAVFNEGLAQIGWKVAVLGLLAVVFLLPLRPLSKRLTR
ncbi:MAG: ABC transporter permease [Actinobacteria bacterium]|nr:MAG: ABC transporter permease [Actinomycetota bacterium]